MSIGFIDQNGHFNASGTVPCAGPAADMWHLDASAKVQVA
jgi:hypothetical protein